MIADLRKRRQTLVAEIWARLRAMGVARRHDRRRQIDQLLKLAEGTPYAEEADAARKMAKKLQEERSCAG